MGSRGEAMALTLEAAGPVPSHETCVPLSAVDLIGEATKLARGAEEGRGCSAIGVSGKGRKSHGGGTKKDGEARTQ